MEKRTTQQMQARDSSTPLRLLILDDDALDADLCIRELKKAGFTLRADVVDTQDGFAEKLQSRDYDLILSDFRIPTWSGIGAFRHLKESGKDIPFILVTGTLGEEAAVDLIKEGIADYILKDRLARLPLAVERALQEKSTRDERERAIQSLRESEERVRLLLDSTAEAIYGINLLGNCTFCNASSLRLLGYESPRDLLGKQMHWLMHHTRPDGTRYPVEECQIYTAFRDGKGSHVDNEVLWRRDGSSFPAEYWSYPVMRDGEPIGSVVTFVDITARKQAEANIRRERDRAQQYLDIADVMLLALDVDGRVTLINRKGRSILGWEEHELLGRKWIDTFLPARTRDALGESFRSLVAGNLLHSENPVLTKSGQERMIAWRNTVLRDDAGQVIGTLSSGEDVTDRRRAECELRRSEARVQQLVESSIIGVAIGDLSGKLIDANSAFLALLRYTRQELLSGALRWDALTPPEFQDSDRHAVEQLKSVGVATPWEKELIRKDGTRISVLIGITALAAADGEIEGVAFVLDISERKQLEQQFRQAQKMESVGRLAGGIAHDFNNLLGVIIGYSEIFEEKLDHEDPLRPKVEQIKKAGQRAALLTRQLLAFSRQQVLEPRVLNLNLVVTETLAMLRRLIGEDIELTSVPDPELGLVKADQGQIEQIILNLAVNARDAMPQGGRLRIATRNAELDEIYMRHHPPVICGSYVMLSVSDTGCGMDHATQTRIFDPFFTTKEQGKGTGLGLSTVYGVVKQSGGYIWVYSEPGLGATFKIYLPRVGGVVTPSNPAQSDENLTRGWQTVLLVEDSEPLRELAKELLEDCGYKVLEAASGDEALRVAERFEQPIHLLMTDVVMPGLDGRALARRLTCECPEMKVLFMSGYTDDVIVHHGLLDAGVALLQKPFSRADLAGKVREVLGGETVQEVGSSGGVRENRS